MSSLDPLRTVFAGDHRCCSGRFEEPDRCRVRSHVQGRKDPVHAPSLQADAGRTPRLRPVDQPGADDGVRTAQPVRRHPDQALAAEYRELRAWIGSIPPDQRHAIQSVDSLHQHGERYPVNHHALPRLNLLDLCRWPKARQPPSVNIRNVVRAAAIAVAIPILATGCSKKKSTSTTVAPVTTTVAVAGATDTTAGAATDTTAATGATTTAAK